MAPAVPAARRNDRRLHFVAVIKSLAMIYILVSSTREVYGNPDAGGTKPGKAPSQDLLFPVEVAALIASSRETSDLVAHFDAPPGSIRCWLDQSLYGRLMKFRRYLRAKIGSTPSPNKKRSDSI